MGVVLLTVATIIAYSLRSTCMLGRADEAREMSVVTCKIVKMVVVLVPQQHGGFDSVHDDVYYGGAISL